MFLILTGKENVNHYFTTHLTKTSNRSHNEICKNHNVKNMLKVVFQSEIDSCVDLFARIY